MEEGQQRDSYFEPEPEEAPGWTPDEGDLTGSTNSVLTQSSGAASRDSGGGSYFQPEPEEEDASAVVPDPGFVRPAADRVRPRGRDCVKCVVVGDDRVGKTSLLTTYGTDQFPLEHIPTVFEPFQVNHQGEGNSLWRMSLHDTARQEDYDSERVLTYVGADVVVITFSVSSPASLANIRTRWIPEIRQHAGQVPIIIVATKSDLRTNCHVCHKLSQLNLSPVTVHQGQKVAKKVRAAAYYECSALNNPADLKSLFDSVFTVAMTKKLNKRRSQEKIAAHKLLLKHLICFNHKDKTSAGKTTTTLVRRDS